MRDNREYGKRLVVAVCQNYGVKINLLDRQLKKIIGEGYIATNVVRKRNVPLNVLEKVIKLLSTYPSHIIELDNLERELNAYDKKKKAVKGKDIKRLKKARKLYASALKQLKKSVGITGGIVGIDVDSYESLKQLKENRYDDDYVTGSFGFDDEDDDFFSDGYSDYDSPSELSYESLMGGNMGRRNSDMYSDVIPTQAPAQQMNHYDTEFQSKMFDQIAYLSDMLSTLAQQQNGVLSVVAQMTGNTPVVAPRPIVREEYNRQEDYHMTIDPVDEEPQVYTSGNLTPGEEIECDIEEDEEEINVVEEPISEDRKKGDYVDPMY